MSKTSQLDKPQFLHCSQDAIIIKEGIYCIICKSETNRPTKKFKSCKALFYHYFSSDSGHGQYSTPTRKECIVELQNISNRIQKEVLTQ